MAYISESRVRRVDLMENTKRDQTCLFFILVFDTSCIRSNSEMSASNVINWDKHLHKVASAYIRFLFSVRFYFVVSIQETAEIGTWRNCIDDNYECLFLFCERSAYGSRLAYNMLHRGLGAIDVQTWIPPQLLHSHVTMYAISSLFTYYYPYI